jgi:lipoprotein-releasing system permease protein
MSNWTVIFRIARTHLLSKFKQTGTAALGVTFGIGAYITLVCFMTGLNGMLDDLILNQTPHIHLYNEIEPSKEQPLDLLGELAGSVKVVHSIKPKQRLKKIHNAQPLMAYLQNNEAVRGVVPRLQSQIFYLSGAIELGGTLTGLEIGPEMELFNFGDYVVEGNPNLIDHTDSSVLLGSGVASKLSVKVGDRVQVSNSAGEVFPLKIVGIYQSGIADLDDIQSFASIKTVQKVLGESEGYVTDIHVKLFDIDRAASMALFLEDQFGVKAVDIKTANAQFETGTTIRNLITYAVSITLLIVAGFGIYNILNMLIYEKMNDIAILKATGFSGSDVQYIFMAQALIIGLVGGGLGLLLGFGLSHLIDRTPFETEALPTVTTYPVNHDPNFYLIGITFALVSTFLAGYLPSLRAKRIDPVRIIRGQ